MDSFRILAELRRELEQLNVAIVALQQIQARTAMGRGRPPKWLTDAK
jgi:hypothetical protein